MLVSDVMEMKRVEVVTAPSSHTILEAARMLSGRRIGAVVVIDTDGQVDGVLSERDIIESIAHHGERALKMKIREVMTDDVVTCGPTATNSDALNLMVDNGIRHLPVLKDGKLSGFISISDVVKARFRELESIRRQSALPVGPEHL